MKFVAIIQARMGSTRLPNKVLMPVLDRPLLGWMLDRVKSCAEIDDVIIATTTAIADDVIVQYANSVGVRVYRGSEEDVLDRYYQAACIFELDAVIRLTADCPLIDPRILTEMIQTYKTNELDFLSNSEPLPSTWPDGMDVSIVSFDALRKAWEEAVKPSDREHVTFYFWNNPKLFKCERLEHAPDLSNYRLTIDYKEDFDLLKPIIEHFGVENTASFANISMGEIITFLDSHPDVFRLNEKYVRGLGWASALEADKKMGL